MKQGIDMSAGGRQFPGIAVVFFGEENTGRQKKNQENVMLYDDL